MIILLSEPWPQAKVVLCLKEFNCPERGLDFALRSWEIPLFSLNYALFSGSVGLSSVQSLSHVWLFATPTDYSMPGFLSITNSQSLLKLMAIKSVMPSNHLILCRSLLLLPSIFLSIRGFSNKSVLHIRWPKYWSFSFSISPSDEYSGLISFRMDWLDLLAVQKTLKSLPQHHSSKHQFFGAQLSL